MSKFAVIKTGGKQYRVVKGQVLEVEKLDRKPDTKVAFDNVLMIADKDDVKIGKPFVKDAVVEAKVLEQTKGEKINGFKYKAKSRYRRKYGHRQQLTKIEITAIK